jgi:hypothetical protein
MLQNSQSRWQFEEIIHPTFLDMKKNVYDPCNFTCSQPMKEIESAEYGAYTFKLNEYSILFRVAKITPTKTGQFVTLWKREKNGPIMPYDISDPIDFFIVCTSNERFSGHFVFPKSILCEQGVLSINGKGGKRAIRVYSPWDTALNKQATKTQGWQLKYYLETDQTGKVDYAKARMLYFSN